MSGLDQSDASRQRDEWRVSFWKLVSGLPYHGWRRLAHSILVPMAVTVVLARVAERIFGRAQA